LVDVYVHEADEGIGHAFNKGILLARGRYIRPLSDDDITYPVAMGQAVALMEADSSIDMLFCRMVKHPLGQDPLLTRSLVGTDYAASVWGPVWRGGCGAGQIFRRRACAVAGLMLPCSLAQDVEYVMRFIDRGLRVTVSGLVLAYHPQWPHSGGVLDRTSWQKDFAEVCERYGIGAYIVDVGGEPTVKLQRLPGSRP